MRLLLAPALVVIVVFAAALSALLRYSVLEFVPGSLRTGGLTLANFTGILSRQYLGAVWDTLLLSLATTVLTLVASYPVAYALARTRSARARSALLVLTLAPFFTGAIVRTYAWVLVLGNTVLTWPVPMLFTPRGVLVGLVHFSMPTSGISRTGIRLELKVGTGGGVWSRHSVAYHRSENPAGGKDRIAVGLNDTAITTKVGRVMKASRTATATRSIRKGCARPPRSGGRPRRAGRASPPGPPPRRRRRLAS